MRRAAPASRSVREWPSADVIVVSPHLDDAVLSLGAAIASLTRSGGQVTIVTAFAGDPESERSASEWERRCGFTTAGEAARIGRLEDARACDLVGAKPIWLPFDRTSPEEEVAPHLSAAVEGADAVLVPGFPCRHEKHFEAAHIVLRNPPQGAKLGFYVEQPYAMWRLLGREYEVGRRGMNFLSVALRRRSTAAEQSPRLHPALEELVTGTVQWTAVRRTSRDWVAKWRAILAYSSQLRAFARLMPLGMALYEWQWGGEAVAWLPRQP